MAFLTPVHVGAVVSCYCDVLEVGRSSIRIMVEVWINSQHDGEPIKVTEGEFVFVAIDENGRTRAIHNSLAVAAPANSRRSMQVPTADASE